MLIPVHFNNLGLVQLLIVSLLFRHVVSLNKDDVNAVFYQDKDKTSSGPHFQYYLQFQDLDDIQAVAAATGVNPIGWVCIQAGVFLFYDYPDFEADSPDEVKIFAGHNKCSEPDPLGKLGSVRHAANKFLPVHTPHISAFDGKYYSGQVYTVEEQSNRNLAGVIPVNSFITVGDSAWTVETYGGYSYCIIPFVDPDHPHRIHVCLVPEATNIFSQSAFSRQWSHVHKDCDSATNLHVVNLTTCFDYQSGMVQGPAVSPLLPNPDPGAGAGGIDAGADNSFFAGDCSTFGELAQLIRWRVNHNFLELFQLALPQDKRHAWRAELLDVTFEVATAYLPAWVATTEFLYQVREFFIYFVEKAVWSDPGAVPPSQKNNGSRKDATYNTLVAIQEVKECLLRLDRGGRLGDREGRLRDVFERIGKSGTKIPESSILTPLRSSKKLDPLMEFVWVVINLVSAACHYVKEYDSNFWLDYTSIANDMYLRPMVEQWISVDNLKNYYPIIFGGYELRRKYDKIAVATSDMFKRVQFLEVLPRPGSVAKLIAG